MTKRKDPSGEKTKTGPKTNWKMTPDRIKKLEEAFAMDCTVLEACYYADISTPTYYEWLKAHPELSSKFERLRERPVFLARKTVVQGVTEDKDFAFKYLQKKRKLEFGDEPVPAVQNTINNNLPVDESQKISSVIKQNERPDSMDPIEQGQEG
jgi:hypothetical protein